MLNGKRWVPWIGWAVSLWPAFVIISSATWKLTRNAWYVGGAGSTSIGGKGEDGYRSGE